MKTLLRMQYLSTKIILVSKLESILKHRKNNFSFKTATIDEEVNKFRHQQSISCIEHTHKIFKRKY